MKLFKQVRAVREEFHSVGAVRIVSEYAKIERNTRQAAKELRVGVIGSASKRFFEKYLLKTFFKKKEKSVDLEAKNKVLVIVSHWNSGVFDLEDAVWLVGWFLDFCKMCQERDLASLKKRLRIK